MRWMREEFGGKWKDIGYRLPIGQQMDSDSCGIYCLNSLAHTIFEEPLVTPKTQAGERMKYFVELAKAHNDYVSI